MEGSSYHKFLGIAGVVVVGLGVFIASQFAQSVPVVERRSREASAQKMEHSPAPAMEDEGLRREASVPPMSRALQHGDADRQEAVRFDLSVPKEQRKFCGNCDPYRRMFASRFSREEQLFLDRLGQFSKLTKSEVWRIAANSKQAFAALTPDVKPLLREFNMVSLRFHEIRSDVARRLADKGMVVDQVEAPQSASADTSVIVGRRGDRYQLVIITPGLDAVFDEALHKRSLSRSAFVAKANEVLLRYIP